MYGVTFSFLYLWLRQHEIKRQKSMLCLQLMVCCFLSCNLESQNKIVSQNRCHKL
jgi:hypothetical protein